MNTQITKLLLKNNITHHWQCYDFTCELDIQVSLAFYFPSEMQ